MINFKNDADFMNPVAGSAAAMQKSISQFKTQIDLLVSM